MKEKMEDERSKMAARAHVPCHLPSLNFHRRSSRRGFTLIEVLATMLLIAIVLPTVMRGVAAASGTATQTRRRTEAAGLAQSKLEELITTSEWQAGVLSGDFGADYPDYRWRAQVNAWPLDQTTAGIQQVDCIVAWTTRNGTEDSVMVSTLTYARSTSATAGGGLGG